MQTFLFWNLNGRDRIDLLCDVCREQQIDVLALAESGSSVVETLDRLKSGVSETYFAPDSTTPRVQVFGRASTAGLRERMGDASGRMTVRSLLTSRGEFLLVIVHLVDKRNWGESDQAMQTTVLAEDIRRIENDVGHQRTIVFGDLNMNPFEHGVVGAQGLHALMDRRLVSAGKRTVQGRDYPFFYNPMWNLLGDTTAGPPGTFYYRRNVPISYDWNMLDQVLIRPDVMEYFNDAVDVITRIGDTELLTNSGRPNPEKGSDHLPLVFNLNVD